MAKTWTCAHCGTRNPQTILTCTNCRRIQGSVVVPGSSWAPPISPPPAPAPRPPVGQASSPPVSGWAAHAAESNWRPGQALTITLATILVGGLLAIGFTVASQPLSSPAPSPIQGLANSPRSYEVAVADLEIGDCFDFKEPAADPVEVVIAGPCTEPHANELFKVLTLSTGFYPGDIALTSTTRALCGPVFEAYVGHRYENTELDYRWIAPNEAAWTAGDHTIRCYVLDQRAGLLTASVKAPPGTTLPPLTPTMDPLQGRVAKAGTLTYGDCWDGTRGQPDSDGNVIIRPCFQDHQYEVFWVAPISSFPPSDVTEAFWRDYQCPAEFKTYVGSDPNDSELRIWLLMPTAAQWRDGDRQVSCSLHDPVDPTLNTALYDSGR